MANITQRRAGEFQRAVFQMLLDKADGMAAKDVLAEIPRCMKLTEFETGYYNAPNSPQRFEKLVRFGTIGPVKAG